MAAPLEAQGPGAADATPAVWLARVASPPVDGRVGVIVPSFSTSRVYGPCPYEKRVGSSPAVGDTAHVAFGADGPPVIVFWEPALGGTNIDAGWVIAQATVDGTADDTAAILAALAKLPAGGLGGGAVVVPSTPTNIAKVSASIPLTSGQRLIAGSMAGPQIAGNVAGPLLTSASNGGVDPLNNFISVENLSLLNVSADPAASAYTFHQIGNLYLHRVNATARAVGGHIGRCRACILLHVDDIRTGGLGSNVCDAGLIVDESSHMARILNSSFTDSKGGLRWLGSAGGRAEGNHLEALAGDTSIGAPFNAAFAISKLWGVEIGANYYESCNCSGLVGFSSVGYSDVVQIDTQFMTNCKSPFVDLAGVTHSDIGTMHMRPGAYAPNADGVYNLGSGAATNDVSSRQYLASGSGAPHTP